MNKKIPPFEELILFEDSDYFVINKPAFVSSLEDRVDPNNLLKIAKKYHDNSILCHRLDKETSGALIIAKNMDAYKWMSQQFESRQIKKRYHAIVDGIHDFKKIKLELPISTLAKGSVKIDNREGKRSATIINTVKVFKKHSLVSCQPITGRMHQIRIHLSSLNAPITGDDLYGGKPFYLSSVKRNYKISKYDEERPLINRIALHANSLKFKKISGDMEIVTAPYPKDFRALITQLEKNS